MTPASLSQGAPTRFLDLDIHVPAGTFAPREETHLLATHLLGLMPGTGDGMVAIDMCCGTGALSCVLARRFPGLRIHAVDILPGSVDSTRANAARLGLGDRIRVSQGDLFCGLDRAALMGKVDLVVGNPPYISTARLAGDRAHLLDGEPREAFDGGPYGISILQALVMESPEFLKPGGILAFEFGEGQDRQVPLMFRRSRRYARHRLVEDANGVPRVAVAWTRNDGP